ncbi:MAG: site-specific integrase [Defluviitaleaceae bacterium]|nr:site-specific integrase [Defluviitaleaceae bacterium]
MAKKTNTKINGANYFRVTATVGKKVDGSNIRKQFYGESKRDAETKRDEYMANIKQGLAVNYDKALFGIAFKSWLEDVLRPSVSLSTYKRHEIEYRLRIADCGLAGMKLTEMRAANIQAFYNTLLETCTPTTVRTMHKLINQFFLYCVKADILVKNPMLAVESPKVKNKILTNRALTDIDVEKILNAAKQNRKHFVYAFAIFTGLRAGEILALTHEDVDLNTNTITVNKSVKFLNYDGGYKPLLTSPKTQQGNRTIPIAGAIKKLLRSHICYEMEKHLRLCIPFSPQSILFSSDVCTYRETPNLLRMFKKFCNRLGIDEYTLHSLRHTFCTILVKQGVPLKTASILMGHSDVTITARVYTHVDEDEKRKGIERLSAYFA